MKRCSAVLVFEGFLNNDKSLDDEMQGRIRAGVELFFKRGLDFFIASGNAAHLRDNGYVSSIEKPVYEMITEYAVSLGIPENKILKQKFSRDTVGEIFFNFKDIIKPYDLECIIMSSNYHLARVAEIFSQLVPDEHFTEFVGVDFQPCRPMELECASLNVFRKQFCNITPGDIDTIRGILLTKHVLYNNLSDDERRVFF